VLKYNHPQLSNPESLFIIKTIVFLESMSELQIQTWHSIGPFAYFEKVQSGAKTCLKSIKQNIGIHSKKTTGMTNIERKLTFLQHTKNVSKVLFKLIYYV